MAEQWVRIGHSRRDRRRIIFFERAENGPGTIRRDEITENERDERLGNVVARPVQLPEMYAECTEDGKRRDERQFFAGLVRNNSGAFYGNVEHGTLQKPFLSESYTGGLLTNRRVRIGTKFFVLFYHGPLYTDEMTRDRTTTDKINGIRAERQLGAGRARSCTVANDLWENPGKVSSKNIARFVQNAHGAPNTMVNPCTQYLPPPPYYDRSK